MAECSRFKGSRFWQVKHPVMLYPPPLNEVITKGSQYEITRDHTTQNGCCALVRENGMGQPFFFWDTCGVCYQPYIQKTTQSSFKTSNLKIWIHFPKVNCYHLGSKVNDVSKTLSIQQFPFCHCPPFKRAQGMWAKLDLSGLIFKVSCELLI